MPHPERVFRTVQMSWHPRRLGRGLAVDAHVPQRARVAAVNAVHEGSDTMNLTVYAIDGVTPVVDPTAFVHPTAVLIGDVIVGAGCYVGPAACLRGDFGRLEVRAGANIQDTCVLHGFPGVGTIVEEDGHIGHGACCTAASSSATRSSA